MYALIFEVDRGVIGDTPVRVVIPDEVKHQITEHFRRNLGRTVPDPAMFHLPPGVTLRIEKL